MGTFILHPFTNRIGLYPWSFHGIGSNRALRLVQNTAPRNSWGSEREQQSTRAATDPDADHFYATNGSRA